MVRNHQSVSESRSTEWSSSVIVVEHRFAPMFHSCHATGDDLGTAGGRVLSCEFRCVALQWVQLKTEIRYNNLTWFIIVSLSTSHQRFRRRIGKSRKTQPHNSIWTNEDILKRHFVLSWPVSLPKGSPVKGSGVWYVARPNVWSLKLFYAVLKWCQIFSSYVLPKRV